MEGDTSEVQKLLAQNRKELLEIKRDIHKIKKQLVWNQVASIIRILIFVIPLVLGIIFLMPYFNDVTEGYRTLLRQYNTLTFPQAPAESSSQNTEQGDINELIQRFQEINQ